MKEITKEAKYYRKINNKSVQCTLCPRFCIIKENQYGNCRVRKNVNGSLYSESYGRLCAEAVDPIEKKPLFHFLPGSAVYSIATAGCNLHCKNCQNWQISQSRVDEVPYKIKEPKEIVKDALKAGCRAIAYTYTEPTVFFEYALDIAKIAKKAGIKNILVTNGFTNPDPVKEWSRFMDAEYVDLKAMSNEFYKKVCDARLKPVLDALAIYKQEKVWLEVTNLLISSMNDSNTEIKKLCRWINDNLGCDTPIHFSRSFPYYKMKDINPTSEKKLKEAYSIAKKEGLRYVYIGNLWTDKEENTYCPKCGRIVIERHNFSITRNNLNDGVCSCGMAIAGVWH